MLGSYSWNFGPTENGTDDFFSDILSLPFVNIVDEECNGLITSFVHPTKYRRFALALNPYIVMMFVSTGTGNQQAGVCVIQSVGGNVIGTTSVVNINIKKK